MPLARINRRLLYFAHVPKTGGSSIEAYMRQQGEVALLHNIRPGGMRTTPQHLEREAYEALFHDDFYDAGFAVLRDPMERLVSEYMFRSERPRRWQRTLWMGQYGDRLRVRLGARYPVMGFDAWARAAMARMHRMPTINDNHIRPQVDFVHPDHALFLLERGLEPVFDWIDSMTESPPGPRPAREKVSDGFRPVPSETTRAEVARVYAADYALIAALRGDPAPHATARSHGGT